MAKTKVTTNRISFSVEALKRAAAQNPDVRSAFAARFKKVISPKMAEVVGSHYHAAMKGAAMAARDGVEGADTGVSSVSLPTPLGQAEVGPWAPLDDGYRIRKARLREDLYTKFWRFRGAAYRLLWNAAGAIRIPRVIGTRATPASKGKSTASLIVTSRIEVPSTGNETLDNITRSAFVRGMPSAESRDEAIAGAGSTLFNAFGVAKKKLSPEGIVAVADRRRPLVSKLAEVLGAKAQAALRKISQ